MDDTAADQTAVCPVCGAPPTAPDISSPTQRLDETLMPGAAVSPSVSQSHTEAIPAPSDLSRTEGGGAPSVSSPSLTSPSLTAPGSSSGSSLAQDQTYDLPGQSATGPVDAHDVTMDPSAGRQTIHVAPPKPSRPQMVPGYEVLGTLGRGGMGVVYKARQVKLNRLVALKMILSATHASAEDLARFRAEAEAVAHLQHPNIVQIYEVGEHESRPYCALELLEGGNLQQQVKGEPQTAKRAAEIVETLARAVHYAHERGIVHRDLKPANIMLSAGPATTEGGSNVKATIVHRRSAMQQYKITDFGLAKRLDDDVGQTGTGSVLGTPTYMAPEQAAGKTREIGAAADIYALGAILYDLLAGRPPLRGESVIETLRLVQSVEPVPPSRLQPKVPRDLETICLKCLEKMPARRYASAAALADDLHRFIKNEPIVARPVSAVERALKWARRKPAVAALILVSILGLIGSAVGGVVFARQEQQRAAEANRLRTEADQERDKAIASEQVAETNFRHAREAVELMLTRVGQERLAHEPRMEKVRRDLLTGALAFYQRFLTQRSSDPRLRHETARAFLRVGDIQEMLGDQKVAEKAYHSADALLTDLLKEDPTNAEYLRDRATCRNNLANLLSKSGRHTDADKAYREALTLRSSVVDGPAGKPADRRELAAIGNGLGALLQTRHQFAEAEKAYRQALAALPEQETAPPFRLERARCLNNLGELLAKTGRFADAEKSYEEARAINQELADKHPTVSDYRLDLAAAHDRLGNLRRDTNPKQADASYRRGLKLRETLATEFPTVPVYRQAVGNSHNNLALALQAAGNLAGADRAYRDALAVQEKLAAEMPQVPDFRRELASTYANRAILLQQQNQLVEAEKAYKQALALHERLLADFPTLTEVRQDNAGNLLNYTVLLEGTRRPAEAEKVTRTALAVRTQLAKDFPQVPTYRQELARAHMQLGALLELHGRPDEAEKELRQAAGILGVLAEQWPGVPDYRHLQAIVLQGQARLLQASKQSQEAEAALRRSIALLGKLAEELPNVPSYQQEQARGLNELAIVLAGARRDADAAATWKQAVALQEKLAHRFADQPAYQQELARSLGNLGTVLVRGVSPTESLEPFARAAGIFEALADKNPAVPAVWQELHGAQVNRSNVLAAVGDTAAAEQLWRRQLALLDRRGKTAGGFDCDRDIGLARLALADVLRQRDKLAAAAAEGRAAVSLLQRVKNPDAPRAYLSLAETLLQARQHEEATLAGLACGAPVSAAEILARSAALAAEDKQLPTERRNVLAQSYGAQAVALLQQAVKAGYRDGASFKRSEALSALRQRPDFLALIAELETAKQP